MATEQWETLKSWLLKKKAVERSVMHPDEIRRLDLSGCSIEVLPEELALLTELIVLNLSNNQLKQLPKSLKSLTRLTNLDIRRNNFHALPEVLAEMRLGSLNASANDIEDISVLSHCPGLRVCDLSLNKLSSMDLLFAKENDLRTLNLSGNFLKSIPDELTCLDGLQRLNLSQNMISEIPQSLSKMHELIDLNLADNSISRIDHAFFTLPLEDINLSVNAIEHLALGGLEELEYLNLDENPLSELSLSEGFAPYLKEFSCDSCQLKRFVEFSSTRIESLCFSSNQLDSIPESICRYENLAQLDIDNNMIEELPYAMTNMTRLQTLYISGNPLSDDAKEIIKILAPDICDINMKTGINIERPGEDDLTKMAELIGVLFEIEKDFTIDFDKQLAGITKLYAYEGAELLVAKYEGQVVGMVTMQRLISSAEGDYIGQIEDLVVHEKYRKMGVGSRLINKIRFIALEEYGYKRVQLAADMDNTNAMKFYTRRGFNRTNLNIYHLKK